MRRKLLSLEKKYKRKFGITVDDILLMMIYSKDIEGVPVKVSEQTKVACIKIFKEFTRKRETETNVNISDNRPRVWLPEMRPDPAKLLPGPEPEKPAEA